MFSQLAIAALFNAITPHAAETVDKEIYAAISTTAKTNDEASLMVVYTWHESAGKVSPPVSYDSESREYCGPLQFLCRFTKTHSVYQQYYFWISTIRKYGFTGLVSLDSCKERANARTREAEIILMNAYTGHN